MMIYIRTLNLALRWGQEGEIKAKKLSNFNAF